MSIVERIARRFCGHAEPVELERRLRKTEKRMRRDARKIDQTLRQTVTAQRRR